MKDIWGIFKPAVDKPGAGLDLLFRHQGYMTLRITGKIHSP